MELTAVTDPVAGHGEGPVWWPRWGGLRWVDMLAGDILSLGTSGVVSRHHVADFLSAVRPRATGGMAVSRSRGFALVDAGEDTVRPLGDLWADEQVRMNDGSCDPHGRFYCGSVDRVAGKKRGASYRLNLDHTMDVVLTGVAASNGLAWSPDGSLAYYVDTLTQRIDVFDYGLGGELTGRRALVRIPDQVGSPDGISVDSEGYVWVALLDGWAVHRYTPSGR